MVADIVPVLAAITGLPEDEADALFAQVLSASIQENGGRMDTKAYADAVMTFRDAAPFTLGDLQSGWLAKQEIEAASYSGTDGNTLSMPR
jgi:hypothetical protein